MNLLIYDTRCTILKNDLCFDSQFKNIIQNPSKIRGYNLHYAARQ